MEELLAKEIEKVLTKSDKEKFIVSYQRIATYYKIEESALDKALFERLLTLDLSGKNDKLNYILAIVKDIVNTNKDLIGTNKRLTHEVYVKKEEYLNDLSKLTTKLLNDNNFTGDLVIYCEILLIETHAVNNFPVSNEQMIELNKQIVEYLIGKNLLTYSYFKQCLMKAKLMEKVNTPIDILNEKAKLMVDWDKLIREIYKDRPIIDNGLNII